MFSKPDKSAANRNDSNEPPVRKALACSLLAENMSVEGDLTSDGDVQLDGALRGDLKVAHLAIGETGQVNGSVTADSVEIRGRVSGAITARSVKLYATARVEGDIVQDQLSIEAGAYFAGRSLKMGTPALEQLNLAGVAAE